jgi:hypothetical protein
MARLVFNLACQFLLDPAHPKDLGQIKISQWQLLETRKKQCYVSPN